jgi:tetratricopeptide (TPR) repeat protein
MAICHYWFAKILTTGARLTNDGTLLHEPNIIKAEEHFRRAIEIDPSFSKAYYKLGLLLKNEKQFSNALENFETAIKLNPSFAQAHYSLAVLLMDKEATVELEKYIQKDKVKIFRKTKKKSS